MIKKNSKNSKNNANLENLDDQDYKKDPDKVIDIDLTQGSLSSKELSNRMRRNVQKIDILIKT